MIDLLLAVGAAVWLVGASALLWLFTESRMVRDMSGWEVVWMVAVLIAWPISFVSCWGFELVIIALRHWRWLR